MRKLRQLLDDRSALRQQIDNLNVLHKTALHQNDYLERENKKLALEIGILRGKMAEMEKQLRK